MNFQGLIDQTYATAHIERPKLRKIFESLSECFQDMRQFGFKEKLGRHTCKSSSCGDFLLIGVSKLIKIHCFTWKLRSKKRKQLRLDFNSFVWNQGRASRGEQSGHLKE